MHETFDLPERSYLIWGRDKAHKNVQHNFRALSEWHDISTHWRWNVFCIHPGVFCILWFVIFISVSFRILKRLSWSMCSSPSDGRMSKWLSLQWWLHLVNWQFVYPTQTPSLDIFLLIPVSHLLYLGETLCCSETGMSACNAWRIRGVGLCRDDTLSDFAEWRLSRNFPLSTKSFAKWVFYIHICWRCWGSTLVP